MQRTVPLALLAALLGNGCARPPAASDEGLRVVVAIPPLATFAERIGRPYVHVEVLMRPGQTPHAFAPGPRQVASLEHADAYISIGLPFERRLVRRLTSQGVRIVQAARGIPRLYGAHGSTNHAADRADPHIWLDPKRARRIAANIAEGLAAIDPQHAGHYAAGLRRVQDDLRSLDDELNRLLAPLRGQTFLTLHPAYGYLADSYGLRQAAVEHEGKQPSGRSLVQTIRFARSLGIRTVFFRPQFDARRARVVADEIDGVAIPIDPLAADYFENLRQAAQRLRSAMEGRR